MGKSNMRWGIGHTNIISLGSIIFHKHYSNLKKILYFLQISDLHFLWNIIIVLEKQWLKLWYHVIYLKLYNKEYVIRLRQYILTKVWFFSIWYNVDIMFANFVSHRKIQSRLEIILYIAPGVKCFIKWCMCVFSFPLFLFGETT